MAGAAMSAAWPQTMEPMGTASSIVEESPLDRIGRARLSLMRADGVELAWVEGAMRIPAFGPPGSTLEEIRFDVPRTDLTAFGEASDQPGSFRFVVDRATSLRDGGISGAGATIPGDDGMTRLTTLAAGEGEYDIYDLAMTWDAITPGPVTVSILGGLKAIDARIGKVVDEGGVSTFRDARGVVAVPVVGGGISWQVADGFALTGSASTHSFGGGSSVLDLSAETSIRLSENIGLSAGYQFIRSAIEVQSLGTELEREGVYARIRIEF